MALGNYYATILLYMVLGAFVGTLLGALYGWLGHEVGWWGIGLLLGLIYGTLRGFAVADAS